jgi:ubiquinone/menaquinone biosynthesis C-methylase UbiE
MHERESSGNLAAVQMKYHTSNPLLRYANQRFFETIRSLLSQIDHGDILDTGCGEGVVLELIEDLQNRSFGLDIDMDRLRTARENRLSAPLLQGNLHSLPLPDGQFGTVLALEVLEHVGNPEIALRELYRVTGKYLLVSVPNEPWWRIGNMARLKYLSDFGNTPEHINHWTVRDFKNFVSERFEILDVRTPVLWTFILARK